MGTEEKTDDAAEGDVADVAGTDGNGAGPEASNDSLTVTDNRTGRSYELPIEDDTIRAELVETEVDRRREDV